MKKFLKASLIAIGSILFQCGVFFITRNLGLNAHLLGNNIDAAIPFNANFIYFYFIWYIFLYMVPVILYYKNKEGLKKYLVLATISSIILGITYLVYPTTMVRADFDVNNISTWLTNFIYKADEPVRNCFPSAHCIFAFLFIISTIKEKNISIIIKDIIIFASLMVLPTVLLIKQHVIADVIGAVIYIIIIYFISKLVLKIKPIKNLKIK